MGPKDHGPRWQIPWQAAAAVGGALVFGAGMAAGLHLASASAPRAGHAEASSGVAPQGVGPGVPAFGVATAAPTTRVSDGVDPVPGGCTADGRLIEAAPVMRGAVRIGELQLKYSPQCGAGWARLSLNPGEPAMMGEVTVRAGDGGCLGAYGQVYQAGKPVVSVSVPCQNPASVPGGSGTNHSPQ